MSTVLSRLALLFLITTLPACGDKDEDTADTAGTTDDSGDTGVGDTGSGDTGSGDTGGSGGDSATCSPNQSNFSSSSVPQAGVEWDRSGNSCGTTEGPPSSDQLVIDDFSGVFGGSGSTGTVKSLSHGTFSNETGFYILSDLPAGTDITAVFDEGGTEVTVTFHITSGSPSVLKVDTVRFGG